MCCYSCTLFLVFVGCNVSDKRSKEIGPSSLKDSGERVESCVDFIILLPDYPIDLLLPDYPIDLPLYSHLLHHSFYHEVGLFFTLLFTIVSPLFFYYYPLFSCSLYN